MSCCSHRRGRGGVLGTSDLQPEARSTGGGMGLWWASEAMEAEGQTRGTGLHSVGSDSRSGRTGWKLSES